jgi:hypothetical protein
MGHPNFFIVQQIKVWLYAKSHHLPFIPSSFVASRPLELVVSDVCAICCGFHSSCWGFHSKSRKFTIWGFSFSEILGRAPND